MSRYRMGIRLMASAAGFIAWVVVNAVADRYRKIHPLMRVVAAGFLVCFARGPVTALLG
ncbi:hypothetical protein [Glutamicibacter sp.]|uniref:hypothetical protein n=1 Tax=Glutamicibacter sp. TaxID=1931995 RepID=UPI002B47A9CF|nr:hypothetical protein [Glutamicibacter sp.]HJX80062.1 hypothetical protein [Glutamicibacter sp.]